MAEHIFSTLDFSMNYSWNPGLSSARRSRAIRVPKMDMPGCGRRLHHRLNTPDLVEFSYDSSPLISKIYSDYGRAVYGGTHTCIRFGFRTISRVDEVNAESKGVLQ